MGAMGYAKTMSRFTWDKVTDKVEGIYTQAHEAILKQRSAASAANPFRQGRSRLI
jgi:hypothetical protein